MPNLMRTSAPPPANARRRLPCAEWLEPRRLLAASLVKDINTTPGGSHPTGLVDLNGTLLFGAGAPEGPGVWTEGLYKTDGTAAGTVRVGAAANAPGILNPVVAGRQVFYTPNALNPNESMWVTDGTDAGTRRVFTGRYSLRAPGVLGDRMLFSGNRADTGYELWASDGTTAGTYLVKDIRRGTEGSFPSFVGHGPGGELLFVANDGVHGYELWRTDGTGDGTYLVKDVLPGPGNGSSSVGAEFNGKVYFGGDDGAGNRGLWVSDGSPSGTTLLRRLGTDGTEAANGANGAAYAVSHVGSSLYFFADDGGRALVDNPNGFHTWLWKSDGTAEGTVRVAPVSPAMQDVVYFPPVDMGNGVALFPTYGRMWRTDGTAEGTFAVREYDHGYFSAAITASEGVGYYQWTFGESQVWRTDGTIAGTSALPVTVPEATFYDDPPFRIVHSGGAVYFPGEPLGADTGTELVRIPDGSSTPQVIDIDRSRLDGSSVLWYAAAGPYAFFLNRGYSPDYGSYHLWRSDGTPEGTTDLFDAGNDPNNYAIRTWDPVVLGDRFLFKLYEKIWSVDWKTGEHHVLDQGPYADDISSPFLNGDKVYYAKRDAAGASSLWVSDGVAPGAPLPARPSYGLMVTDKFDAVAALGEIVYFSATGPADDAAFPGGELWRTDGTPQGTYRVKDLDPNANASLTGLANAGGTLVFIGARATDGRTLWKSDGTEAGTIPLTAGAGPDAPQVVPYNGTLPLEMAVAGGVYYFIGSVAGGPEDVELWRSDGTPAGTYRVRDITPGPIGSFPRHLTGAGDRVFFVAGDELWASDGTEAGTRQLSTNLHYAIAPLGIGTINGPAGLTATPGGMLYFAANDGDRGVELWRSDGTPEGTVLEADLPLYSGLSILSRMAAVGETVYFTGNDWTHGNEPWKAGYDGGPVADAGGPYQVGQDETVTLTGAASRPGPDGSPIVSYEWDFDFNPTLPFAADARGETVQYTGHDGPLRARVILRVTDAAGRSYTDLAEIAVAPRGPEVIDRQVRMSPQQDIALRFSEPVNRLDSGDLRVVNADTGRPLDPGMLGLVGGSNVSRRTAARWVALTRLPPGRYRATLVAAGFGDLFNTPMASDYTFEFAVDPAAVLSRSLFYNNSAFDARGAADDNRDDFAVATDKRPMPAGQAQPTFANVSSYTKGINGLFVDLDGPVGALTAADFDFRVGRTGDPAAWAAAPAPRFFLRKGAGVGGSDRVQFVWPDGSIRNRWLRVTVKANARTNLTSPDVFYYGSLVGEAGAGSATVVSMADYAATRAARSGGPAAVDNPYDFDRDGRVSALDLGTVRRSIFSTLPPVGPPRAAGAAAVRRVADDVL